MWAMLVGLFPSTVWAAPQGIAQAVGLGSPGHAFQLVPFLVGLIAHMMNSVGFGIIFIATARATHLRGAGLIIAGMLWGLIVYAAMYWVLLRGLLASTATSFLSANPERSWILGHLMFGLILGTLVGYGRFRQPKPARRGGRPLPN